MNDKVRYAVFLHSGPLKRVYVDIPEKAHKLLKDLARKNGNSIKAQLTLLIADAVEKPKRATAVRKKLKAHIKKRGRKHGRKAKKKAKK